MAQDCSRTCRSSWSSPRRRGSAAVLADLIEFVIEFSPYVIGFWFFIFRADFRGRTIAKWRSRAGVRHTLTGLEIVGSTLAGTFFVWIPLLWLWLASR